MSSSVQREYHGIEDTVFWKRYTKTIDNMVQQSLGELKTAGDDKYRNIQGRVWALELVQALPGRIVEGLTADDAAPET
jgi:hypothetical protein